jgi:transcription antitermination factor NusG
MMSSTGSAAPLPQSASSQAPESGWYALYTYPRHEKRIAEQIENRRFCCFVPLYRSVRRWKDRRKEIDQVLFPGYVFVQMALEDKLKVLQLPGVVRLVTSKGRPVPVSADEIESLRDRLSRGAKLKPHPYLRTGRRVRVRRGPLEGLEGVIVRRKESCRFVFSIDLIQRSVAVEIDEADLEAT